LIQVDPGQIGIVTVASGEGIGQIFQQLGVAGIVMGGQTNNPSVEELLECIQSVHTEKIILLPNNKNIILAAEQAAKLSNEQRVIVIPTRSFPQGISAMLPYQPDGDLDEVAQSMRESMDAVITGEVTIATRTVELDGVKVEDGQVIGLLNGALKIAGDSINTIVCELLGLTNLDDMELITLYYGNDIQEEQAQQLADVLADMYPDLEFEIVMGGQPHYHYILGVE
jgi:dihydroxyacetone kinase-like predicted kinase